MAMIKNRGGRRPGSGRKPGSANVKTREMADQIAKSGIMPLEYMINLMREPKPKRGRGEAEGNYGLRIQNWQRQCFEAAKASAPYTHPRLQAVEYTSPTDDEPVNHSLQVTFVHAPPRPSFTPEEHD